MKKILNIIIAVVFGLEGMLFPVAGFGKSIWDRALLQRDSGFRRNDSATEFVEYTLEKNDFMRYGLSIPDKYGRVQGDVSEFGAEGEFIVLIKDTHCNYESDKNVVSILDILNRDYGIGLFGVEGADGLVDVSIFNGCSDSDRRKKVADDYLREGWLAPSEALALERGKDCRFIIWGVEDKGLYLENFRCFREVYRDSGMVIDVFDTAGDVIGRLKERLYPEELIRFDTEVVKYRENKIGLVDFVKYLSESPLTPALSPGGRGCVDIEKYPNLVMILQASEIEETLEPLQAEKERMELIGRLQKELPREDAQEVINISLHHKLGRVPSARYYNFLGQYVTDGYEEFGRYRQLIELHSQIDSDSVFGEIDELVEEIYDGNALHEIDEAVRILRTLLRLGVSRDELARYKNEKYKITDIINALVVMAGANGVAVPSLLKNIAQIEGFFLEPEMFYGYALERDNVIVDNLISRMNGSGEHNAALVVGGFHLDAMRQLLKERGFKTAVIYPSITKYDNGAKERYLARMMDELFDPERILGEIGNASLRPPLIGAGWSNDFINIVAQICRELGVDAPNLAKESELSAFRDALEQVIRGKDRISDTVRGLLQSINEELERQGLRRIDFGPANISWLTAPEEWRGETEFSYGLGGIIKRTTGCVDKIKAYLERNGKCVNVRGINMDVDKRLGQALQGYGIDVQVVLEYAITHACNVLDYDIRGWGDNRVAIAVLDRSQHLAENHVGDGFVGINRYVIEEMLPALADRFGVDAAMEVLGLILSHEFRHEISGKGKEIEEQLMMQDILVMDEIFGEQWEENQIILEYMLNGVMGIQHWISRKRQKAKMSMGYAKTGVQTGQRQSQNQIVVQQERKEQSNGENHFFIGDAHGNLDGLIAELEGAGLAQVADRKGLEKQLEEFKSALLNNGGDLSRIEEALKYVEWTGGDTVLVQHGDLLDRMNKGIECLLLLVFLKMQARKMGRGDVVILLGNHELAYLGGPMIGDIHYFSYYGGYEIPVKELIRQLISMNFIQAMYLYDGIYCVHGGLSKRMEDELRRKIEPDEPDGVTKDAVVRLSNEMLVEAAKSDNKNKYYQSLFMGKGIFWMKYTELKEDASPQIVAHVAHQQMGSIEPVKANAINIEFGMWRETNGRFGFLQGNPSGNAVVWNEYGNNRWKKSYLLDINSAWGINWREIEEVSEEELNSGYKILFPNKIYCLPCSSRELEIINEDNRVYNILMEDGNSCIIDIGDNAVAVERRQLEEVTEPLPAELAAAVGHVQPDYILQDGQFVTKPDGCEIDTWEQWADVKSRLTQWTNWISPFELASESISFMYISTAIGYYWYGDILMEKALLTENLYALFAVKLMHELVHRKIARSSMKGLTGIRGEVIAVAVETQFFLAQDEEFRQAVIDNINSLIRYLEKENPGDKRVNILRADIEYLNRVQGMDLSTEGLIEKAINYLNNTQGNVVQKAKKRGLLDIREMSRILKRLQQAGTLAPSTPAYIGWLKAPEEYRSDTEIIDAASPRQTRTETVELSVKGEIRRYGLTVDEQFYVYGIDVNKILQNAMNKAQVRAFEMGYSQPRYKDVMVVRALDKSMYLAENHVWDGFVGVNRYVLDKIIPYITENYGQDKAEEFLGLVFSHEFTHEATGEGFGIETQMRVDDVCEMDRLFGVNWETNHPGLVRILNVDVYEISLIRSLSDDKEVVKVVPGLTVIPSESERFVLELASFGANEGSICFNKHIEPNGRVEFEIYKETGDFIGTLIPGQRMVIGPAGNHAWHKYLNGLGNEDYVFQVDSLEAVFIIEMEQNGAVNITTEKVIEEEKTEVFEWPADVDWLGVPDGSLYYGDILFVDSDGVVETGKPSVIAKIIKGEEEGFNFVVNAGEKEVKVDIDPRIKESLPNISAIMQDAFKGLFSRSERMGYPIQIPEEITLARVEKSHQYVEYLGDNVIGINVILLQGLKEEYLSVLLEHHLIRLCTGWDDEAEPTIRNDDMRRLQAAMDAQKRKMAEPAPMLGTAAAHAGGTQYALRDGEFEEPAEIKGTAYRHWVSVRNSIISSGWVSPEDLAAMNIYFRNMTERAGYIEDGEIFLDKKLSGDDYPALFSLILMHEIAHKMLYTKLQMQGYYGEIFALWAETMLFLESENRNDYIRQISKFIGENSAEDKAEALKRYLIFLLQISATCSDRAHIDQKKVLQLVIEYFEENVVLYKGKDYRRGYNAAKTHNRLNPDMMLAVLNASMMRLATLKAPGTNLSERESQFARNEAGKLPSVEGLENKTLQELGMEVSVRNADINLENIFFTVKKTEEGRRYGFPKREGAVRPQDLIYVLAEKVSGKLHIIVTDALWADVLKNDPEMLASIIDHEWTEKVRGNHAEASSRMWNYIDDSGMNSFYEWYLNQLAKCGEHAELKRLISDLDHTDKRFKSYAAASLIVAQVEDITSHVIENREYLIEQIYQAIFRMQGRDITLRELIQKMQVSTSINNAELVGIIFMVGEVLDPLFVGDPGEKSNAVVMEVLDEIVMGMQDVRFETEDSKLFIALMNAVRANTAYAYNNVVSVSAGFVDNADVPAGVIIDFRHWITDIHEDGSFTFNPGMEAVLSQIKGTKNRIAVRVKDSDRQLAEKIKAAVVCGKQIILIDEKESEEYTKEALIDSGVDKANIAWIVAEIPEAGSTLDKMAKGADIKLVHMEDESAFHLTLLFAFLYAKSSSVMGGNVPDDVEFLIRRFYALFGDDEENIEEIIRDFGRTGIISVRFISIKEVLNQIRNMKLYIDTAA